MYAPNSVAQNETTPQNPAFAMALTDPRFVARSRVFRGEIIPAAYAIGTIVAELTAGLDMGKVVPYVAGGKDGADTPIGVLGSTIRDGQLRHQGTSTVPQDIPVTVYFGGIFRSQFMPNYDSFVQNSLNGTTDTDGVFTF